MGHSVWGLHHWLLLFSEGQQGKACESLFERHFVIQDMETAKKRNEDTGQGQGDTKGKAIIGLM